MIFECCAHRTKSFHLTSHTWWILPGSLIFFLGASSKNWEEPGYDRMRLSNSYEGTSCNNYNIICFKRDDIGKMSVIIILLWRVKQRTERLYCWCSFIIYIHTNFCSHYSLEHTFILEFGEVFVYYRKPCNYNTFEWVRPRGGRRTEWKCR